MLQVELVSKWFFLCFLAEVGTITLAIVRFLKNKRNAVRGGSTMIQRYFRRNFNKTPSLPLRDRDMHF